MSEDPDKLQYLRTIVPPEYTPASIRTSLASEGIILGIGKARVSGLRRETSAIAVAGTDVQLKGEGEDIDPGVKGTPASSSAVSVSMLDFFSPVIIRGCTNTIMAKKRKRRRQEVSVPLVAIFMSLSCRYPFLALQ